MNNSTYFCDECDGLVIKIGDPFIVNSNERLCEECYDKRNNPVECPICKMVYAIGHGEEFGDYDFVCGDCIDKLIEMKEEKKMEQELGFVLKVEEVLGSLEVELRELYSGQEDIFSNEHIQMRELLTTIIATRKDVAKIGAKLIPKSEFDL
ncbi:hypothetical protein COK41_18145 [Bacillus cereus]|nr:hypothetical protein COK41_18145 [Bacillus cereus]